MHRFKVELLAILCKKRLNNLQDLFLLSEWTNDNNIEKSGLEAQMNGNVKE